MPCRKWGQVAAQGPHAAGVAAFVQFGVQRGGVGKALVPTLAEVRLERVQAGFQMTAAPGLRDELGGLAGSLADACLHRGYRVEQEETPRPPSCAG